MNENTENNGSQETQAGGQGNQIRMIPTGDIVPNPANPRLDVGDVSELAESIKAQGIRQNLLVTPTRDGKYTLVIGHRRLAAAKQAGLTQVPCAVAALSDREQREIMLVENSQRRDLTLLEEANGIQGLLDLGESKADIAKKTGRSVKAPQPIRLKKDSGDYAHFYAGAKPKPQSEKEREAQARQEEEQRRKAVRDGFALRARQNRLRFLTDYCRNLKPLSQENISLQLDLLGVWAVAELEHKGAPHAGWSGDVDEIGEEDLTLLCQLKGWDEETAQASFDKLDPAQQRLLALLVIFEATVGEKGSYWKWESNLDTVGRPYYKALKHAGYQVSDHERQALDGAYADEEA